MPITLDGTLGITTPSLTTGSFINTGAESIGGNLTFTTAGSRIIGDFSNATVANRVMFKTSTANGITRISAIPDGTGAGSIFTAYGANDPTNSGTLSIYQNASASAIIASVTGTGTATPMTFATGGSERMRIDTSGNVGIGTSSPLVPLHVVTTGTGTAMGDNVSTTLRSLVSGRASTLQLSDGTTSGYMSMVGGALGFATGGSTERMRIDASGNVGIGTSSPQNTVSVGTTASSQKGYSIDWTGAGGPYAVAQFTADSNTGEIRIGGVRTNFFPTFYSNNAERMRIDSAGLVGIGTNSPTSQLHVVSNGKGLLIESGAGGYTSVGFKSAGGVSASFTTSASTISIGSLNGPGTGSNGELVIFPSNLNRLAINTNGQITMPYQPSFFAIKTSAGGAYTVGTPIKFNVIPTNVGSNYASATGRFTAPVYGVYFFSMKNLQTNADSVIRFYFYLNGAQADSTYGLSGSDGGYQSRFQDTTGLYKEQQTSAIMTLNAGDYVTVVQKVGTASVDDNGYSTFLGHLIG